jgi:hypothetical protein
MKRLAQMCFVLFAVALLTAGCESSANSDACVERYNNDYIDKGTADDIGVDQYCENTGNLDDDPNSWP